MPRLKLDEVEQASHRALISHGARDDTARHVARAIRVAESNGNRICGLYYLESYCRQLETGRINGIAEPVVTVDRPGAVRVDGRLGFAQSAFAAGLPVAIESARTNGICGMSVEHTHTCTSLGYFTEQFAWAGLLAIGATNATPRVSPPGGSTPVLGTNPIAMAVPDGSGGVAFQFDFSTSAVALGKITRATASASWSRCSQRPSQAVGSASTYHLSRHPTANPMTWASSTSWSTPPRTAGPDSTRGSWHWEKASWGNPAHVSREPTGFRRTRWRSKTTCGSSSWGWQPADQSGSTGSGFNPVQDRLGDQEPTGHGLQTVEGHTVHAQATPVGLDR